MVPKGTAVSLFFLDYSYKQDSSGEYRSTDPRNFRLKGRHDTALCNVDVTYYCRTSQGLSK